MNVDPTAHGPDTLAVSGHPCLARWSTAAFGLQPDARPGEDPSLGEHLHIADASAVGCSACSAAWRLRTHTCRAGW